MAFYTSETLLPYFDQCGQVSTDTRALPAGALFVALRGPNFNGNAYAAQALEAGAAYVVVDDPAYHPPGDERYLRVADGLQALQGLATAHRRRFDIPFLGLTGSNGKTTTKELIHAVLQTEQKVHATKGNLNNHIGVPLTLLAIPADAEIAIVEMGANQPGDIQELAEIAEPTHGLITNVGYAHIENLGSLEGVQRTKGALFDFVAGHGGPLFVNQADHRVVAAAREAQPRITYGTPESDFWAEIDAIELDGMRLRVYSRHWEGGQPFESSLSGEHNAMNIVAAIAVGHHFGLPLDHIRKGLAAYRSSNNRSQLLRRGGFTLWMDAYNANPSSMRAAIAHVFAVQPDKVALILGDMYEVGDDSPAIHAELGRFINQHRPVVTIGVGPQMKHLVEAIEAEAHWFASIEDIQSQLPTLLRGVEVILLKGSRAMALEKLVDCLPEG
jgi:UDP-N-acetylmuramoyl-tripeptide--D-alanyl-D-alanine ligase